MKKTVRLLALLLALAMTLSLSAFAEEEATAQPDAQPETAAVTSPDDVMVTINGTAILRSTVDGIAENMTYYYAQYGYDTSDAGLQQWLSQYALQYAVQLEMMRQKAAELGLDQFTDEEKAEIEKANAEEWAEIVDTYVSYYGGLTAESTEEDKNAARISVLSMLESWGYTEAGELENAFDNAVLDKVEAYMIEGAVVTDEDIRAKFDEQVASDEATYGADVAMYEYMTQYYGQTSYYVPEGYRGITHILLQVSDELMGEYESLSARLEEQQDEAEGTEPTGDAATAAPDAEPTEVPEPPVTQEQVDAAYQAILDSVQPTVDEINTKLAQGVPFSELVAEYGTDPGMETEPNKSLGYSVHMDSILWDPVFVQAAFSVDHVGDVAAPVVGSYGVHIVQYTRDVPAGPVELTEEIQNAIREELLSARENELFSATMEQWLADAVITYSAEAQELMADAEE